MRIDGIHSHWCIKMKILDVSIINIHTGIYIYIYILYAAGHEPYKLRFISHLPTSKRP